MKMLQPYRAYQKIKMDKRGIVILTSVELIQVVLKDVKKQKMQK